MDKNYSAWIHNDTTVDEVPVLVEEEASPSGARRPRRSIVTNGMMFTLIAAGLGGIAYAAGTPSSPDEGSKTQQSTEDSTTADEDSGPGAATVETTTTDSTSDDSTTESATDESDDDASDDTSDSDASDEDSSDEDSSDDDIRTYARRWRQPGPPGGAPAMNPPEVAAPDRGFQQRPGGPRLADANELAGRPR